LKQDLKAPKNNQTNDDGNRQQNQIEKIPVKENSDQMAQPTHPQSFLISKKIFPFYCSSSLHFNDCNQKSNSVTQLVIAIHVSSYESLSSILKTWANCTEIYEILPPNTNTTFITFSTQPFSSDYIALKYPNVTLFDATKKLLKHLHSQYLNSHWYMIIKDMTLLYIDNLYKALQGMPTFTDPLTENYYCGYPLKQPNTTIIFASGIVSEKR
jgi:hypothetical protein